MMYIEHTGLEDNLHHILTNRVPTSSSPSAAAASALLLARVREAAHSATSQEAREAENQKCNKEWVRRPEPKLVPVESLNTLDVVKQLASRPKETNGTIDQLAKSEAQDEKEEEQYEILHIEDIDQVEPPVKPTAGERSIDSAERKPVADTTHFVIDIQRDEIQENLEERAILDEDEEYEYIVTRVPKRKVPSQSLQHKEVNQSTPVQTHFNPESKRKIRPVPEAIPIDIHQRKILNGSLPFPETTPLSPQRGNITSEPSFVDNFDYNSHQDTATAALSQGYCQASHNKDVQMGIDILSKIRQFFNWLPTNQYDTTSPDHQEGKRKRRSEDYSESASERLIKYRKVENHFPKYVTQTKDDDIIEFLPPAPPQQSRKPFYSTNMSSGRRSLLDKPPLRKSMFSVPQITTRLIKNTSYADIEFSDDDEPQLVLPSTSSDVRRVPQIRNIPIIQTDERCNSASQKPPPPLLEPRTGAILSSGDDLLRRPSYADALRQSNPRVSSVRVGNVLGTRNNSLSSSGGATPSESSRFLNGFSSLRTNASSNMARPSILAQEKESDEREKYQQLLKQVAPGVYGFSCENKMPTPSQRRRSGFMSAAAATSSARSSPANARRSVGLGLSVLKRPPLSSTINLDDEEDDEVIFAGVSQMNNTSKASKIKGAVVIDDDGDNDISEIIDLESAADRHVLSQCAKIKQEENFLSKSGAENADVRKKMSLPFVEPVNTFKERISSCPHIKDNWLENLQSKWSIRKKNRLDEVHETAKVVEKLALERKAAEADIQERLRNFQIVDPGLFVVDDFEDVEPEPEFVELTPEHRSRINASVCGPLDQVLVSKFNLNITRRDIHTLCGHNWLNDEVINFYMNLLTERGDLKSKSHGLPSVYAMNTFFVPRLMQAGHAGVKRWTRKVDIFAKDVIPVPVHVGGVHWCMAIIHMKNRTIKYYDSMGTPNPSVLKALEQYLKDESLDKRKQPFDTSDFQIESVQGVPRQMNGSDCGVFSCMFAEYITRNKEITFSQQHMEYFRDKMILEIVTGELLQ
uniref:Ulp1 protease family protein n=1 Tax=Musca domestica TaxID=7370 RepID=T1PC08_MUSDO